MTSRVIETYSDQLATRNLVEKYSKLLELPTGHDIISLGEGGTPLIPAPKLGHWISPNVQLYLKLEGLNPTGSFKDRGMTVAISGAVRTGKDTVICASTGNTSASAAAYAARAGLKCVVLIPEGKIALGKLAQAMIYGATIVLISGNFDKALELVREISSREPLEMVNSLNPLRIQGQKTAAFEICDQLSCAPDIHALPVGNAGNITAYWLGYQEYKQLGITSKLPKIYGFQAEGAAPIVNGSIVTHPETVASAIKIGNPASWSSALTARDESGGLIRSVSDEQILEAYNKTANLEGIFAEAASVTPIAGLKMMAEEGHFSEPCTITVTLTGNGLKDSALALEECTVQPIRVNADYHAVRSAIPGLI